MHKLLFLLAITVVLASCSSNVNPNIFTDEQRAQILDVCTTGQGVDGAFGAEYQPGEDYKVTGARYLETGETDTARVSGNDNVFTEELRQQLRTYNGSPAEVSLVVCTEILSESVGELCEFENTFSTDSSADAFTLQWADREYSLSVRNLQTGEELGAIESSGRGVCPFSAIFTDDEPNKEWFAAPNERDRLALLENLDSSTPN